MKILISPAKRMKVNNDFLEYKGYPVFLEKAQRLVEVLRQKTIPELQSIFQANLKITEENYQRYQAFSFYENLTPAVLAFDGIQYAYMGSNVFTYAEYAYLNRHLYILSGLYGVLNAMDGIRPYRLEMQAGLRVGAYKNLYEFWGSSLYEEIFQSREPVLNLTSVEYKKSFFPFLKKEDCCITVYFYEWANGKLVEKAVYAKMARGAMVRYMAENQIEDINRIKEFQEFGYRYAEAYSSDTVYVFIKS